MKKISFLILLFSVIFIILIFIVFQFSCKTSPVALQPVYKEFILTFSGDVMAHDLNYMMKDYNKIYQDVKDILTGDDLSFANIEMPVCDELPLSSFPNFNVHSNYLTAAVDAGFDVFSFANNHSNDQRLKGIMGSIASFKKIRAAYKTEDRSIYFSGLKEKAEDKFSPVLIEKNGFKILFLAVTELLNSYDVSKSFVYFSPPSPGERKNLLNKINAMRKNNPCDLFVLSLHLYEKEYGREVFAEKKNWFKELAAAGADVIWAHHPHVLQGWEFVDIEYDSEVPAKGAGLMEKTKMYKKAFFMYSMGNFISGQRKILNYKNPAHYWEYTGDSALMQIKFFTEKGLSLENASIEPVLITAYPGKDGIVIKKFDENWALSLEDAEKNYYLKRIQLMKSYLPF